MRARLLGTWAICVLAAYGCGGGGSSTPPPSPDARDAPRGDAPADRGADQRPDTAGGDVSADRGDAADTGASDAPRDGADARDGGAVDAGIDVAAPTCADGIKNSDETDIDCGGHCGKCSPTKSCLIGADCTFGVCRTNHTCGDCNLASDCPGTETECVHRSCTAGVCGMSLSAAGTVLAQQTVGDCQSRQCAADGTVKMVADNSDIHDDRNPCTNDTCVGGIPMNANLPANSSCGGLNRCNTTGQCVGCLTETDCPGSDTVCQTRTCTQGICGITFKAPGFALTDPTVGDCKGQQCDGMGNSVAFNLNTDLPVDGNPCTTDECSAGTPAHRPISSGTTCGTGLVCDGANHCVACLSASTCPGSDTECQTRTCINGVCGISNTTAGKITVAQVARDCKRIECNGTGSTFTVPDVTDLPVDGNPCTSDVCNGDTPQNPSLMAGTNCGGTNVCDGLGACVGCLTAATCPGTDNECHTRTCSGAHQCGIMNAAAGKPLAIQMGGDCHQIQCDGAGNTQTVIDTTDVRVDGNVCTQDVCTSDGTPMNPALAQGTSCGTNLMCNGSGLCVGCVTAANCGVDTPCLKHSCTASGQCMVTPVASGTVLTDPTPGDCKRSQCDGAGNVAVVVDDTDVPVDGNQCTQDVCMSGMPSNPPQPAETACNQNGGSRCNGIAGASVCVQCNAVSQCPGGDDECHARTCSAAGICGVVNTAAGTVVSDPAGNCQRKQCDNMGNIATVADPTDVQDDGTICTVDTCNGTTPVHMPVAAGTLCSDHLGAVCNGTGACVGCNFATDCPGSDTECQTRVCTAGMCSVMNTANGTAVMGQKVGDCLKNVCSAGAIISVADDNDIFVDGKQCTQDLCSGGVVSNPPVTPTGTTCNQNGGALCDSTGACVQCLSDANCDNTHDTACNKNRCVAGGCTFVPELVNTVVADTTTGDCHKNVCDGLGAVSSLVDDSDLPVDGLTCTQDICNGGLATNPPVTVGTACSQNGGSRCDASGACVPSFMVARIGDGTSTALTNVATAIVIEERLESSGALVRTISVPSVTGPPNPLTISGTADSEGALALSGDKHSVAIAGYAATAGTTGVVASASQRGAALIFANGTVDTSTTFGTTTFAGDNVRGAVSNDGTQVWSTGNTGGAGSQRGVFISTLGTAASTLIESATNAGHVCEIIGGQLLCDAANGKQGIFGFGTALPTGTPPATVTALPGTTADTAGSYYAFVMLDLVGNDGTIDTMYVADDRAAAPGGIQKWTLSSGTWSIVWNTNASAGTAGVRGLTGYAVGTSAVLVATTASASPTPNAIIRLIDSGTTPTAASITTLVPAVAGQVTVFRGIALAPQ